ncbi:MAG: LytTR family DNA-binding domain-containing protein [Nitrospinota bacterium]|nr:LytTR family DNA-binding domain-containing protein [Nitrospinota bacterium]
MIRIVIVEDEPAAARMLKKMLERIPGLSIGSLAICSSVGEAREHLEKEGADVVFLDLNVRGESGFGAVEDFMAAPFDTIIATANTEHAVRAFEEGAVDYLVKPFSQERLEKAMSRVGSEQREKPVRRILIKEHQGITAIPVEKIRMVRSAGDYTELYLVDGGRKLCAKSMDYLEHSLPRDFMRVHRSAIVRLSEVKAVKVEPGGKYMAEIDGVDELVPVGRTYYKKLKESLEV